MSSYQLLDPREEEDLFKTRLLNVEEKPFKRITKRLTVLSRVAVQAVQEKTPPPEAEAGADDANTGEEKDDKAATLKEIAQLREDVTLDFAAFDASIARLQFLSAANASERARYADRHRAIAETCQNVKEDMGGLREQLGQARATLTQRQAFDVLADRITSSKTLWPRADQQAAITKLEDECRQLQLESEAYLATWRERKQQFARIMDESMRLRRQIRDEAEEVERREGMDEDESQAAGANGPAAATAAAGTPNTALAAGTPVHAGGSTPIPNPTESPAPDNGGGAGEDDSGLKPEAAAADGSTISRAASRGNSREATPSATAAAPAPGGDVDMEAATPAPAVGGDEAPADGSTEKMDTT